MAALAGGDQAGAAGVAPHVSLVSLRVLDAVGAGTTSHVINAIQWAVAHRDEYGINILNISLGHPPYESAATDPLVQAVEAAVRAGIVVVSSAGNIGKNPVTGLVGYAGISSPGNAPSALTVGAFKTFETATRTDDLVADFSSRGPTWFDGRGQARRRRARPSSGGPCDQLADALPDLPADCAGPSTASACR